MLECREVCCLRLAQLLWRNLNHGKGIIKDLQGSFTDVCIKKISKLMSHFLQVQDVYSKSTGIAPMDEYTIFCENGICGYHFEAIFWA